MLWTFTLTNRAVSKVIHLHGDGEILQVVQELEEWSELLEADPLENKELWNQTMLFIQDSDVGAGELRVSTLLQEDGAKIHTKPNRSPFIFPKESLSVCGELEAVR